MSNDYLYNNNNNNNNSKNNNIRKINQWCDFFKSNGIIIFARICSSDKLKAVNLTYGLMENCQFGFDGFLLEQWKDWEYWDLGEVNAMS